MILNDAKKYFFNCYTDKDILCEYFSEIVNIDLASSYIEFHLLK